MEINDFHENPRKYMETDGNQWKSMVSMEIHGNTWKPMEINENQ